MQMEEEVISKTGSQSANDDMSLELEEDAEYRSCICFVGYTVLLEAEICWN
jgi:hypothetical protein